MLFFFLAFAALLLPSVIGFGVVTSGNSLIVTTDGGLVFTVDQTTGDITSLKFNGIEAQDQSGKHSQISSGIGASCTWVQTGNESNYIKITCTTGTLIQQVLDSLLYSNIITKKFQFSYYVARRNDPAIHMATFTTAEPTVGELRYIARLNRATVPNGFPQSDVNGGTAIEGSDVFLVNGQTRSKFYSSRQFIDDAVKGVTGPNIGVFMIVPGTGFESSSGGPFFRDIDNQGSAQQELYFCELHCINQYSSANQSLFSLADMNSGHTNTEADRQGMHGPYALWFTTGAAPSGAIDTTFWDGLAVSGWVTQSGRGRVTGTATGIASTFSTLQSIGFSNSVAEYWVRTDTSGKFTSPFMKPGTYTMTLYKVELAVATQTVTVTAGGLLTSNIASAEANPAVIWQIGDFDGTPRGFLNADMIERMHPSDTRMHSWGPVTFTIGQAVSSFPMAIFQAVGPVTIRFTLASNQGGARTLQIGTTLAFAGARPQITLNGFTGPAPSPPSQPDSRGVTRGTWRGNNIMYTVSIPSGVLLTGSSVNTLTINPISGSSGDGFLSPNFVFDAIRLF
ncbi:hypothetical protein D9757_001197 [Collybiopsis confluens]|uniref:rhamnogalacturonan endolyase n=1 Tax=Collybiopsis confluens TaxID=2823264 RepID=A0A8H5MGN5_9AGAR|nr:hypothetical protein D9757_001197 [Collybiopsis confluens]